MRQILSESRYELVKPYFDRNVTRLLITDQSNLPDIIGELNSFSDDCRYAYIPLIISFINLKKTNKSKYKTQLKT